MHALGVEGKVVADQLGHTLDVNQNIYTQSPVALRREALNRLEQALSYKVFKRCSIVSVVLEVTDLYGAGDRDRTGDIQLGKLTFYH